MVTHPVRVYTASIEKVTLIPGFGRTWLGLSRHNQDIDSRFTPTRRCLAVMAVLAIPTYRSVEGTCAPHLSRVSAAMTFAAKAL